MTQEIPQIHGEVRWFTERLEPGQSEGPIHKGTDLPASEDHPSGCATVVRQPTDIVPYLAGDYGVQAAGVLIPPTERSPIQVPDEQPQTDDTLPSEVRLIPIENIHVVNPRERNKQRFQQIVANISRIGLKKPITVRERKNGLFDLVCGQGRLEALKQLGETMVPAIVRKVSAEDAMIMGLVENIARQKPRTMETVRELVALRERGHNHREIGRKTGICVSNVASLLILHDRGEQTLLNAVDSGRIPLSAAMIIAHSEDKDIQSALTRALEEKKISHTELRSARRVADSRKANDGRKRQGKGSHKVTAESVVRTFRREQEKQRQALKKAELCSARLVFTVSALRMLLRDDNFVNLLRAEGLETVPEYIAEQIKKGENHG